MKEMKNIIIGLGNTILKDDRVGIYIAEELGKKVKNFEIILTSYSGFYLIDFILNKNIAIFIDSIVTGNDDVGTVRLMREGNFKKTNPFSIHSVDLISAIEKSRLFNMDIPEEIYFNTIQVSDNLTIDENFSYEIDNKKEKILSDVIEKLENISNFSNIKQNDIKSIL